MSTDLTTAIAVKDRYSAELMRHPNVVGVGVGVLAGTPIIRVYVREYQRWEGPYDLEGIPVMTELIGDVRALGAAVAEHAAGRAPGGEATS